MDTSRDYVSPPRPGQLFPQVIAITGLAQTGKNATLKALAKLLPSYATADCSDIARQWAKEKGFPDFEHFVRRVTDEPDFMPDYDRQIDAQSMERMKHPPLIIVGRLPHYFASVAKVEAFKVGLTLLTDRVRGSRAAKKGISLEKLHQRDVDDYRRYGDLYAVSIPADVGDAPDDVHMEISTEFYAPDEVAAHIYETARCWANGWSFNPHHFGVDPSAEQVAA